MRWYHLFMVLFCILVLSVTPIDAAKSKGLFSGTILDVELEEFVADIPDTPTYIAEKEEATRINPQDSESWIAIGKARMNAKQWQEAETAFLRAIDVDPDNQDGWIGYFIALQTLEKYEELLSKSQELIEKNPEQAIGYRFKGNALFYLDRFDEAMEACDKAIALGDKTAVKIKTTLPNGMTWSWTNWNMYTVYNGPPESDTTFPISKPVRLTYIDTYHWNDGISLPSSGTIGLRDEGGKEYGPWETKGLPGQNGNENAHWIANPDVIIPAGMYTVIDSDPDTWSSNAESDYAGFSGVKYDEYLTETKPL